MVGNRGNTGPAEPPASLVAALRKLLRPLVRLMLDSGITYPFLANLLKSVFVEVADKNFRIEGKKQTDSRISLLSGVHRKDVKRLRGEGGSGEAAPATVSLGAQLVARWTGMPQYLDPDGHPGPLPRLASEGGAISFEGLVGSVNKDIRSRVVLDEWVRLGVARVDDKDRVRLNVDAFVPEQGYDEKAYYLGRNLHDHIAAAVHNVAGQRPPFLERSVYYDRLGAGSVAALAELSRELGMNALQTVNRKALELQAQDAEDSDAKLRMNFGIYYFSAASENSDEEE